jgi:hypothetical protein
VKANRLPRSGRILRLIPAAAAGRCVGEPRVDRAKIHKIIDNAALKSFDSALNVPNRD